MIGFINALDEWFADYVADEYPTENMADFLKSFGYVELTNRTNQGKTQPIPVTINNTSDRAQVSLDDRYQVMGWIRLPGQMTLANDVEGNNYAFGFQSNPVQKVGIRWVIAWRVELGEEFIFDLIKALPYKFSITGYQIASVDRSSLSVDVDHEAIYRTELGDTVYEKHRFTWNICAIQVNLSFILNAACEVQEDCCEDSFTTEDSICIQTQDSACLIQE